MMIDLRRRERGKTRTLVRIIYTPETGAVRLIGRPDWARHLIAACDFARLGAAQFVDAVRDRYPDGSSASVYGAPFAVLL
jgi:hypothetical protein